MAVLSRSMPWMLNTDGSASMSLLVYRRRVQTYIDYKIVDPSAVSMSDGDLELSGSESAWNASGWTRLRVSPTTCNQQALSLSATIPAQASPKLLILREGVWKHSGDEAWLDSNGGEDGLSVTCSTTNPQWYQEAGASGFYCPMALIVSPPPASVASAVFNDGSYSDSDLAYWLLHNFSGQSDAAWGSGMTFCKSTGEALLWPLGGGSLGSTPYIPRTTTATISSNVANVKSGQTATITFTVPSADANDVAEILAGSSVISSHQAQGYSGTFSVQPYVAGRQARVLVTGGSLVSLVGTVSNGSYSNTWTGQFIPAPNYEGPAEILFEELAVFTEHSRGLVTVRGSMPSSALYVNGRQPVAAISSSRSQLRAGETATLTVSLSSPSTDFTAADLKASNATITSFRGSNNSRFTALLTPARNVAGNCVVSVDAQSFTAPWGEKNVASNLTIPAETTIPKVSIASSTSKLTVGQTANVTFSLSEPVASFNQSSVGVSLGSLGNFAGNGTSYSAVFSPAQDASGTANITINAGAVSDAAGNPCGKASLSLRVNTSRPTVTILAPRSLGAGSNAVVSFVLSDSSSTFSPLSVSATGGTLSGFRGSRKQYYATFTPAQNSTANGTIAVAAGAFSSAAGSPSAANSLTSPIQIDTRPLTVQLTSSASSVRRSVGSVTLTIQTNKPVTSLRETHIKASSGRVSSLRGSNTTFYATYRPAATFAGNVAITIPANQFADAFGNKNQAASLSSAITVLPT